MADVKLLSLWASPYAMRALLALELKGIEYEIIPEDLRSKSELLLGSNPVHKKVPVLIHNGKSICESSIIVEYVNDTWPDKNPCFFPGGAYGRAEQRFWGDFIEKKFEESMLKIFKLSKDAESAAAANEELIENWKVFECELERRGSEPFFGGKAMSYVDILVVPLALWMAAFAEVAGMKQPSEDECPRLHKLFKSAVETSAGKAGLPDLPKLCVYVTMILPHIRM